MVNASERQFVKVAPPTVHAGIGTALRQAFAGPCDRASNKQFEDLLARLN
jgi:hypothetical protein